MILSPCPLWRTRSPEFPCLGRARDPTANVQVWVAVIICDPPLPRWLRPYASRFPSRRVNLCTQERAAAPGCEEQQRGEQSLRPRWDNRDLAQTSYRQLPPQRPQWPQLSLASSPKPRERTVPPGSGSHQGRGVGWSMFSRALRTAPEWLIPWIIRGRCSAGMKVSVGGVSGRGPGERDVSLRTAASLSLRRRSLACSEPQFPHL